jgi:hypothetical protein
MGFNAVFPAVGSDGIPTVRPGWLGSRGFLGARGAAVRGAWALPDRLSLCTLPMTALRVTPWLSRTAIWLALRPSVQSFLRSSTRSSVQDIFAPPWLSSVTSSPTRNSSHFAGTEIPALSF